jgi:cyclophilin family peptidyl-prolyl cis-trans isomerase
MSCTEKQIQHFIGKIVSNQPMEWNRMANKRRIEAREKAQQKQKTEKTIMYVGIAIAVLVVIGIAWLLWPGSTPEEAAAPAESTDPFSAASGPYNAYPPMTIDPNKEYFATFKLAKGGEIVIQLFPDKAPKTVNSFVFLAREGYYDGTTFHRVLEGFMAQGGDPTGTGMGGPGYEFENEDSDLTFDREGVVAMANAGRDTNGSQFFITFSPQERLNGGYTIFGQVVEGMDVVKSITLRDPDTFPDFPGDTIDSVTITEQ